MLPSCHPSRGSATPTPAPMSTPAAPLMLPRGANGIRRTLSATLPPCRCWRTRLEKNQQASWRPCPEKRATPRAGQGTGHCRGCGLLVLGSPLGSREFVSSTLAAKRGQQDELLARLPALQKLQSAWMLLWLCAAPRCNYLLRTVPASLRNSPPRTTRRSRDASPFFWRGGEEPLDPSR